MTHYKVLYYPDFVPDTTWLRQTLLLCDGVVRIVPDDVSPEDPDHLKQLLDAVGGCLESVAPGQGDVALEHGDKDRLGRAFQAVAQQCTRSRDEIELTISNGGSLAISDHVFVHDAKLSDFELKRNGLLNEAVKGLAPDRFHVVQRDASDLILAGVASRIAHHLGLDAITDRPMPFAYAALRGVPHRADMDGRAEGALLSTVAELMIPSEVAHVDVQRYTEIRDSYAAIREAFKRLTVELAALHRLTRVDDAQEFVARVNSVAREFEADYQQYRNSQFARRFRDWAPMCVGGALSIVGTLVHPLVGAGIATTSFAIQVVERLTAAPATDRKRVFNMMSGIRRDVVAGSGIRRLV